MLLIKVTVLFKEILMHHLVKHRIPEIVKGLIQPTRDPNHRAATVLSVSKVPVQSFRPG